MSEPTYEHDPDETEHALRQVEARRALPTRWVAVLLLFAVGGLGAILAFGLPARLQAAADSKAAFDAPPTGPTQSFRIIHPRRMAADDSLRLPAEIQPIQETAIYARATGYLKARYADLGDVVRKGQLLAVIDAPELREELRVAEATIEQTKASIEQAEVRRKLAAANLERSAKLVKKGLVTLQEMDERNAALAGEVAGLAVLRATLVSQAASVRRLRELLRFLRLRAPFGGRITERLVEIGTLVSPGATGPALFRLANWDPARVFVRVPQVFAPAVKKGQVVKLRVRGHEGRLFEGEVERTSGALDSARALLVEVHVPNESGALMGGMYATAELAVHRADPAWRIPASAILTGDGTPKVVVHRVGRAHFVPVTIEEEEGAEVGVRGALGPADEILVAPDPTLVPGVALTIDRSPPPEMPGSPKKAAAPAGKEAAKPRQ